LTKLSALFLLALPTILLGAEPSNITLTSSEPTAKFGHAVTLTAVVSPSGATGEVTFYDGANVLEVEPLANGQATLVTRLLPFGAQSLKAYYGGDATYAPSTSATVAEEIETVPSRGFATPILGPSEVLSGFLPVVADFNADGLIDIAVASSSPNSVQIFLGNGDGTFQAPVNYAAGIVAASLVAGDFNGDGKIDLAFSSSVDGASVNVLPGNGDGTFGAPVNSSLTTEADAMAVGDFNGDGKSDLAIVNFDKGGITVILGNGDGTFQAPISYGSGFLYRYSIVAADFNGDGKADLAAITYASDGSAFYAVNVLLGNGDGTFQVPLSHAVPDVLYYLAVGDFNGDGNADLVGNIDLANEVLLGNGDGTFQPAATYGGKAALGPPTVSDFNGDGKADVISAGSHTESDLVIAVSLGNGDGTLRPAELYTSVTGSSTGLTVSADFNHDGRPDFATIQNGEMNVQLGSKAAPSTTVLSSSFNPSFYGADVTLTAAVSPTTATGTVTFYSGTTELGTGAVEDGTATFATATLPVGLQNLSAVYGGETYEFPSTSNTLAQQVNIAPTSTSLFSSPNPSNPGQAVNLVAEITPAAATGSVEFYAGSTILGTSAVVNGKATFSVSTLPAGSHRLTATYLGNTDYSPSVSYIVIQVVN
jgi:hypothetical protein